MALIFRARQHGFSRSSAFKRFIGSARFGFGHALGGETKRL
jgi:hypothetical protein